MQVRVLAILGACAGLCAILAVQAARVYRAEAKTQQAALQELTVDYGKLEDQLTRLQAAVDDAAQVEKEKAANEAAQDKENSDALQRVESVPSPVPNTRVPAGVLAELQLAAKRASHSE